MWALVGKFAVGYITTRLLLSLFKGIYSTFVANLFGLNLNIKKTGKWAVVTGSTDGIGKAYAFELAQRGLNIVLISRTHSKLETVAKELKDKYPVETKQVVADFTRTDIYDDIGRALSGLDIGVLVNNVGMSYEYPEYLTDVPNVVDFSTNLMNMNITSVNRMTLIVLPGMEARGRGLIINVSSLSAISPTPLLTLYAATKAYVIAFSRHLAIECREKGVSVQCVVPGFVVSNLSKMRRATWMVPNPTTYVRQTMASVGVSSRTGGYLVHKMMIYAIELQACLLPAFVLENHVLGTMKAMRRKYLKKMEKKE